MNPGSTISDSELLDRIPNASAILRKGSVACGNELFFGKFGLNPSESLGKLSLSRFFTPASVKKLRASLKDGLPPEGLELLATGFEGRELTLVVYASTLPEEEEAFLLTLQDITARTERSRQLGDAYERYKTFVDKAGEGVADVLGENIAYCNPGFAAIFGFESPDDVRGKSWLSLIAEKDVERLKSHLTKASKKKVEPAPVRFSAVRADKVQKAVSARFVLHDGLETGEFILLAEDVTELDQSLSSVKTHQEEFELVVEVISALRLSDGPDSIARGAMEATMKALGYESGCVYLSVRGAKQPALICERGLPERLKERLGAMDDDEGLGALLAKTQDAQFFSDGKYPAHLPHRALLKELEFTHGVFVPLIADGKCIGSLFFGSKKPKRASRGLATFFALLSRELGGALANSRRYEDVKEGRDNLQSLMEAIADTPYTLAPNGQFLYLSSSIAGLSGFTTEDFFDNPTLWLSLVVAEDKRILLDRTANLESLGVSHSSEYRILPKGKATSRWIRDSITIHRNAEGSVDKVYGILSDVTSFKNLAGELIHVNQLGTGILSNIEQGVVVFDSEYRCSQWNEAMETITGVAKNKALGAPLSSLFKPSANDQLTTFVMKALMGNRVEDVEFTTEVASTNKTLALRGRFFALHDASGTLIGASGILTDLGEKKLLEQGLHESEQALQNVIDTMGDILMITELKGNVLEVNRAFLRDLGYERSEVIGREFPYPWLLEEEMGRYVLWIATLREKNWLHDFDMTWRTKSGRELSMSLSTTLLRNSVGEPIAMVNIARDISERKRLESELQRRNRQVELLNRIISAANRSVDFNEIFLIVADELRSVVPFDAMNVALAQDDGENFLLYGFAGLGAEMLGKTVKASSTAAHLAVNSGQIMIIDDLQADEYKQFNASRLGLRSHISIPIVLKDKTFGSFNLGKNESRFFNEEHIAFLEPVAQQIGAIIDRVQLFKRVVEDASYIHNLLDSIDSVVFTLDRELKILQVNKAWHEFIRETGRQPDENFLGMSVFESYGEGAPGDIFRSAGHQVLSGELRFFAQEFHIATRHGERMYQLTMNPMVINGAITGLVITQADITALKQSELTVKQNNERLIALNESLRATAEEKETLYAETAQKSREIEMRNKELDDFTYVVSHDLKEPLISIEGFSKILQLDFRDVITGDGRDHLDSIVGAATRMKALIDDLLMLSRVGRIAESFKPVSLNDVLTDVRTDMEFSLRQRNIDLQIAADLPSVYGSSTHLKIVFRNLIGNAIKFSSGDHPLIEVGFQNAENNQYLFYVRDNGIGIEPEFHNKIFVIFQRLHRREEYEGTGAGLAIVKKIVEMHRGKIWVESEKGKGSTFYFTIPKSLS